jgi:hypothetical protein
MEKTGIQVYGVKEDLKKLNKLAPDLRKQILQDAKAIVEPVIRTASGAYPDKYLSGMSRAWTQGSNKKFPYDRAKAIKGISVKVDTRKKSESTITIIQKNPAATIIDMAGKKGGKTPAGKNMIAGLAMHFGAPSRVMWPSYDLNADRVNQAMKELVETITDQINVALSRSNL